MKKIKKRIKKHSKSKQFSSLCNKLANTLNGLFQEKSLDTFQKASVIYYSTIEILSGAIKKSPYTEEFCRNCYHDYNCCNGMVGISFVESVAIVEFMKRNNLLTEEMIVKIKNRGKEIIEIAGFLRPNAKFDGKAWIKKHKKCLLYDEVKKHCIVYPVRSLACRSMFTISQDHCSHSIIMRLDILAKLGEQCIGYMRYQVGELNFMISNCVEIQKREISGKTNEKTDK